MGYNDLIAAAHHLDVVYTLVVDDDPMSAEQIIARRTIYNKRAIAMLGNGQAAPYTVEEALEGKP